MNFNKSYWVIPVLVLFSSILTQDSCNDTSPPSKPGKALVLFYNVENLFDTIDDPKTKDEEFLPGTDKNWNSERYNKKLRDIAQVIATSDSASLPAVVGLCEVENRAVLEGLINTSALDSVRYGIVHRNSPDRRGIDVAALYDSTRFELISSNFYTVELKDSLNPKTRQIVYFKGLLRHKHEVHFFVCHWPSRRGGADASEHKRMQVAGLIRSKVDSIYSQDKNAAIIIMGDLNDHPDNRSVTETLGARGEGSNSDLVDLFYDEHQRAEGTYNYRGDWGVLDHFIVSSNLLDPSNAISTSQQDAWIVKKDWLLYYDENYDDTKPSRTYGGPNYYGGYSDHLPILLRLEVK